jgi:hypothetical protein
MRVLSGGIFRTCLAAMAMPLAAFAHHSTAAFDAKQTVTLTGTVTKVDWVNPHCYVYIVVDDGGKQVPWAILSGTPTLNLVMPTAPVPEDTTVP